MSILVPTCAKVFPAPKAAIGRRSP